MALKLARSFFKSFFNLLHFDGTFRKRAPSTKILSWQCRYEEIETAGRVYKCAEVCGTDPVLGENVFKSCITRWNAISLPRLNLPCLQLSRRRNNFEQNSIHWKSAKQKYPNENNSLQENKKSKRKPWGQLRHSRCNFKTEELNIGQLLQKMRLVKRKWIIKT